MPAEKHTTILGIFVLGTIIILFSLLYFYYTQKTYKTTQTYVMLFNGSLDGLQVGSPITYRGIKIGQVIDIRIKRIKKTNKIEIPVYTQFYTSEAHHESDNPIHYLIETGWKADVSKPGMISGEASIILEQKPEKPVTSFSYYEGYTVFPTIQIPDEGPSLANTLKSAQLAFKKITDFVQSEKLRDTLNNSSDAMDNFNKFMEKLNNQATPLIANFDKALKEVQGAAYELKGLTEYLSRHPEAIVTGKKR